MSEKAMAVISSTVDKKSSPNFHLPQNSHQSQNPPQISPSPSPTTPTPLPPTSEPTITTSSQQVEGTKGPLSPVKSPSLVEKTVEKTQEFAAKTQAKTQDFATKTQEMTHAFTIVTKSALATASSEVSQALSTTSSLLKNLVEPTLGGAGRSENKANYAQFLTILIDILFNHRSFVKKEVNKFMQNTGRLFDKTFIFPLDRMTYRYLQDAKRIMSYNKVIEQNNMKTMAEKAIPVVSITKSLSEKAIPVVSITKSLSEKVIIPIPSGNSGIGVDAEVKAIDGEAKNDANGTNKSEVTTKDEITTKNEIATKNEITTKNDVQTTDQTQKKSLNKTNPDPSPLQLDQFMDSPDVISSSQSSGLQQGCEIEPILPLPNEPTLNYVPPPSPQHESLPIPLAKLHRSGKGTGNFFSFMGHLIERQKEVLQMTEEVVVPTPDLKQSQRNLTILASHLNNTLEKLNGINAKIVKNTTEWNDGKEERVKVVKEKRMIVDEEIKQRTLAIETSYKERVSHLKHLQSQPIVLPPIDSITTQTREPLGVQQDRILNDFLFNPPIPLDYSPPSKASQSPPNSSSPSLNLFSPTQALPGLSLGRFSPPGGLTEGSTMQKSSSFSPFSQPTHSSLANTINNFDLLPPDVVIGGFGNEDEDAAIEGMIADILSPTE